MKIVLPPGLGDIHWCMLKMESFLQYHGHMMADIGIWTPARPRALEYVSAVACVESAKYLLKPMTRYGDNWKYLFKTPGINAIRSEYPGWDYFLGFNGSLEAGIRIEKILPHCEINWDYKINETFDNTSYGNAFARKNGDYALIFAPNHGFHTKWKYDLDEILESVVSEGLTPILTGAEWDRGVHREGVLSITGETSTGMLLAIIKRAKLFVGYAAGNGILATHFKVPTVMLWSDPYKPGFDTSWNNPSAPYVPIWSQSELISGIKKVLGHNESKW
jgi:hypothetical protein